MHRIEIAVALWENFPYLRKIYNYVGGLCAKEREEEQSSANFCANNFCIHCAVAALQGP